MSLYSTVSDYSKHISFHMPAHNNTLAKNLLECDTTELSYSDNLFNPVGQIQSLQQKLASAYRSEACFISTNGATNSVFCAIFATKHLGDYLIVGKSHCSIYNAMRAFCLRAYHVDELTDVSQIPPAVKTVIFTSPSYFGECLDLNRLCNVLHSKGYYVIVDASHGSHFAFSSILPVSATEYADLVIHSLHKTLPVPTGGSVLCVKDQGLVNNCILAQKLLHSTSPSYLIMSAIDLAVDEFIANGEEYYSNIKEAVTEFCKWLNVEFTVLPSDDFSRLVITSRYDGKAVEEYLNARDIFIEMTYGNKLVLIVTPYNYRHLIYLALTLNDIPLNRLSRYENTDRYVTAHPVATELKFGGDFELVDIEQSLGRKAYVEVGLYPPGAPFIFSHDVIDEKAYTLMKKYRNNCFGLVNNMVCVVK